jgi:hypothetical protein
MDTVTKSTIAMTTMTTIATTGTGIMMIGIVTMGITPIRTMTALKCEGGTTRITNIFRLA